MPGVEQPGHRRGQLSVTPPCHTVLMERQLALIHDDETATPATDWRLDDQTRLLGRQGVAAARQALRQAAHRAARPAA